MLKLHNDEKDVAFNTKVNEVITILRGGKRLCTAPVLEELHWPHRECSDSTGGLPCLHGEDSQVLAMPVSEVFGGERARWYVDAMIIIV
jgi:hypothetical protein